MPFIGPHGLSTMLPSTGAVSPGNGDNGTGKPAYGTLPNPAHPLSAMLRCAYLLNEGSGATFHNSSPAGAGLDATVRVLESPDPPPDSAWEPDENYGYAYNFDGSRIAEVDWSQAGAPSEAPPTVVVVVPLPAIGAGQDQKILTWYEHPYTVLPENGWLDGSIVVDRQPDGNLAVVGYRMEYDASMPATFQEAVGQADIAPGDSGMVVVVWRWMQDETGDLFVNGQLVAQTLPGRYDIYYEYVNARLGFFVKQGDPLEGYTGKLITAYGMDWLDDDEVAEISADPWCMYRRS